MSPYTYESPINSTNKNYDEVAVEVRRLMEKLVPEPNPDGTRIYNFSQKDIIPGEVTAILVKPNGGIEIGLLAVHLEDPKNVGGHALYGSIRWCTPNYAGIHAAWGLLTLETDEDEQ